MNESVLVLDGRSRAALSIVRSLGRKNIHVVVGEAYRSASFFSKYAYKTVLYPRPAEQPDEFVDFLVDYLQRNSIDFLVPVRDDTTELVSKNSQPLGKYTRFVVPRYESYCRARDKSKTILLARELKIPHPRTLLPEEFDRDPERLRSEFDLPIVLKPRVSSGSRGIRIVKSWSELEPSLDCVKSRFGMPMLQEFIPHGGGYGVSVLARGGQIKAFFTHRRIREFPPSGGPSTLSEGVRYPEIEAYSFHLLEQLGWDGPAMVEFRIDKRDHTPKLMEINPRFWGSLENAVFSGVDFPYLLIELAMKGDIDPQMQYEIGRRARWLLFGDLLWYLASPHKLKHLREFCVSAGNGTRDDIIDRHDMGPTFGLLVESLASLFQPSKITHVFKRGW